MTTTTDEQKNATTIALLREFDAHWSIEPPPNGCDYRQLRHDLGYGFRLHWSSYPAGRIEIRGIWPTDASGQQYYPDRYGESAPTISLSATKAPRLMANEIRRRFLPAYLEMYAKKRNQAASHDTYATKSEHTAAVIRARLGAEAISSEKLHDGGTSRTLWLKHNQAHSITVSSDSVRFEHFNAPVDVAIEILRLLQTDAPTHEQDEE